jgi:hypothetical protein
MVLQLVSTSSLVADCQSGSVVTRRFKPADLREMYCASKMDDLRLQVPQRKRHAPWHKSPSCSYIPPSSASDS